MQQALGTGSGLGVPMNGLMQPGGGGAGGPEGSGMVGGMGLGGMGAQPPPAQDVPFDMNDFPALGR
jgi:hypothetical protein